MSLPAMSLGLRFCANRKGGMEKVGGFQPWAQVTWLLLGLAVESPGWVISLLLCTNGLRKWSSDHVGPPFLAVRLFIGATVGQEP